MSILNVEHLTHGFGDRAIFEDVSFRLLKGEHIGLVGANGEGKSTFMSIVTGKLMPDEGKVEWAKNVHAGYLDQHAVLEKGMTIGQVLKSAFDPLLKKEERMNEICDKLGTADPDEMDGLMEELGTIQDELTLHDFYAIDAKVEEVARALGLLDLGLDRDVTDLSGGQRTKVLLAKLLLEKPDILLLDEPTNHLDMESIAWLETYLRNYSGAVIIVAHDRYFLDRVVTKIIELDMGHCTAFSGNYSAYSDKKAMLRDAAIRAYLNQQQEIRHQEAVIAKLKSFNREKSIKRAESREKMLDKIERVEKPVDIDDSMDIRLEPDVISGNDVLTVRELSKSFDAQPLFSHVDFDIRRGERVAIIGNNGTGKTTLAKVIANTTSAEFTQINATVAGKKDMEAVVKEAQQNLGMYGKKTILFIDEIHRFNKGQQDYLLPFVEDGTIILIGATTENPYFEVNAALISRSIIFELKSLEISEVKELILRAVNDKTKGMGNYKARIDEDALDFLADMAGGDARNALNAIELGILTTPRSKDGLIHITLDVASQCIQKRVVRYDKNGDNHYDIISAFIKRHAWLRP